MKKLLAITIALTLLFSGQVNQVNALTITQSVSGRIVLQVESHGEAWYVYPKELARYYLGRPDDAYSIMRTKGLGITNADLAKIPVEGTSTAGDLTLQRKLSGYIVLQVQSHGEAWYIYPVNLKRYYLGRPDDAYALMRNLGLGISNNNLAQIPISPNSLKPNGSSTPTSSTTIFSTNDGHDSDRQQIFEKLNTSRTGAGLSPLTISTQVTNGAQSQANDMTALNYYALTSPTGKRSSDWLKEAGYDVQALAVHIDSFQGSASDAITRWESRSSSQFGDTVLNKDYKELGIGVGRVNETPVYVIYLTLSSADYFSQKTASLTDIAKVRSEMLARVNAERAKVGIAPVKTNSELQLASQRHTDDMLTRAFYDHVSPEGTTPDQRVLAAGYEYRATGENIAKGQTSVQEVMDGWMASQGHRENILNPVYVDVGFGLSFGKNNNGYEILWSQEFGAPR